MSLRRIAAVDVYKGFVMLLMMAEVLFFHTVAEALPDIHSGNSWRIIKHTFPGLVVLCMI